MYYFAELQNSASFRKPEKTKARTLKGAKRAASISQVFKGTTLVVYNQKGYKVATKSNGSWFNYPDESPLNCAPDFLPLSHK